MQSSTAPAIYWGRESYVPGFTLQPKLAAPAKQLALANIAKRHQGPRAAGEGHPDLRDRLQADPDLQRPTIPPSTPTTSTWSPTPIAKVTGDAIVTADGVERPIDVLVVATGFYTTELPIAEHIIGRERPQPGRDLARDAAWRPTRAPRSPGSRTCSSSSAPTPASATRAWCFMIESQVAYIREAIRTMRRNDYADGRADRADAAAAGTPTSSAG